MFDDEIVLVTCSRRASCIGLYTLLTIFDLEPLDLQIVVAPTNQFILAEPVFRSYLGITSSFFLFFELDSQVIGFRLALHWLLLEQFHQSPMRFRLLL
ncbi:hypothetical protein DTW68_18935 [Vibrio harveyi]|nr:hypothetical protein DTW68_18935 [Vibrio harveyi]